MASTSELRERWSGLCERLGGERGRDAAGWLWACVEALHGYPERAYHNLAHVAACLRVLDEMGGEVGVARREEVELALWMHDSVYIAGRPDNEERSAAVAAMVARELGMEPEATAHVRQLVMATRHDRETRTADERLIADVDLSVLGADPEEYDAYADGIRAEYSFLDGERFEEGRGAFLRGMLAREAIFHTEPFRRRFEARARENMARELRGIDRSDSVPG